MTIIIFSQKLQCSINDAPPAEPSSVQLWGRCTVRQPTVCRHTAVDPAHVAVHRPAADDTRLSNYDLITVLRTIYPIIHVKFMLNLNKQNDSRMSNFWWEGTKISPSLFLIFGRQTVPAKKAWRLSFRDHLFFCLFCLVTSQANYSMSEGLAIVRLTHHRLLTKRGQFNGCLHACSMRMVWRPKIQKRDGLILVPSHRKFDILESFVCS